VSAAFAPTVGAKQEISVNPIQAMVWTIRYIFPALCRKVWKPFEVNWNSPFISKSSFIV
jgi:hypothetical protein